MSSAKTIHRGMLNMNLVNNEFRVPADRASEYSAKVIPLAGWSTAVVTIERSSDGVTWAAMESAVTMATGSPVTGDKDCSTAVFLRARVSTAEGSDGYALVELVLTEEV